MGNGLNLLRKLPKLKVIDEANVPLLKGWFENVHEVSNLKDCMPPRDKLLVHYRSFHKKLSCWDLNLKAQSAIDEPACLM